MKSLFNVLPPSVNHLYKTTGNGRFTRRVMTNEGKAAKHALQIQVGRALGLRVPGTEWVDTRNELKVEAVFFFDRLYPKSKRAKLPHLKIDVENYPKLIHDVLSYVSGRDDSSNFDVRLRKFETGDKVGVYIHVKEQLPDLSDLPAGLLELVNQGVSCVTIRERGPGSEGHPEHAVAPGTDGPEPEGVQLSLKLDGG